MPKFVSSREGAPAPDKSNIKLGPDLTAKDPHSDNVQRPAPAAKEPLVPAAVAVEAPKTDATVSEFPPAQVEA